MNGNLDIKQSILLIIRSTSFGSGYHKFIIRIQNPATQKFLTVQNFSMFENVVVVESKDCFKNKKGIFILNLLMLY